MCVSLGKSPAAAKRSEQSRSAEPREHQDCGWAPSRSCHCLLVCLTDGAHHERGRSSAEQSLRVERTGAGGGWSCRTRYVSRTRREQLQRMQASLTTHRQMRDEGEKQQEGQHDERLRRREEPQRCGRVQAQSKTQLGIKTVLPHIGCHRGEGAAGGGRDTNQREMSIRACRVSASV